MWMILSTLSWFLVALAFVLCAFSQSDIDWTKVSVSSASLSWVNATLCLCDLTKGQCDINCCCDNDCSVLRTLGVLSSNCTSATSPATGGLPLIDESNTEICLPSLFRVNEPSLQGAVTINTYRDSSNGLCVVTNNNPTLGTFFKNSDSVTSDAVFNQIAAYDNSSLAFRMTTDDTSSLQSSGNTLQFYKAGDPLLVWNALQQVQSLLLLPSIQGHTSTLCADMQPARFLQSATYTCLRNMINVENICKGQSVLDLQHYLHQLSVLSKPSSTQSTIPFTFNQPQFFDPNTNIQKLTCFQRGNTTLITLDPTCSGGTSNSTDFQSLATGTNLSLFPQPTLTGVQCSNIVQEMKFTVKYQLTSTDVIISAVIVNITFTDFDYSKSVNYYLAQTFTIDYLEESEFTTPIPTSGNPGYLFGSDVIVGVSITSPTDDTRSTIQRQPNNKLSLPTTNPYTLRCTTSNNTYQDLRFRSSVQFGQDLVSGCTLPYTLSDLVNTCASLRDSIRDIQTGTWDSLTHIGRWGNSSYIDPTSRSWTPLLRTIPASLLSPNVYLYPFSYKFFVYDFTHLNHFSNTQPSNYATGCENVLQHVSITFLWTNMGPIHAPQPNIVGARATYHAGTIQWQCANPVYCKSYSTNIDQPEQQFTLTSSVRWVKVWPGSDSADGVTEEEKLKYLVEEEIIPSAPRLFAPLPGDWFYPF